MTINGGGTRIVRNLPHFRWYVGTTIGNTFSNEGLDYIEQFALSNICSLRYNQPFGPEVDRLIKSREDPTWDLRKEVDAELCFTPVFVDKFETFLSYYLYYVLPPEDLTRLLDNILYELLIIHDDDKKLFQTPNLPNPYGTFMAYKPPLLFYHPLKAKYGLIAGCSLPVSFEP